jgi:hypothetical protein
MEQKKFLINDIEWTQCPSIWTGGAVYFYVAFIPEKITIIYNRETKLWDVESEQYYTPGRGYWHEKLGTGFKTVLAAMNSVRRKEV